MKKKKGDHSHNQATTRRRFLQQSTAIGLISSGYFVNPVAGKTSSSPNERLRIAAVGATNRACLLYTSPSPRDLDLSRMPSSA